MIWNPASHVNSTIIDECLKWLQKQGLCLQWDWWS
jgi:hypothetical protein